MLDKLGGVALVDAVGDPAALAADPAAADVEDLHGDLERVLGERDHVGVGAVAEHDRLLLHAPCWSARGRRAAGRPSRSPAPSEAAYIWRCDAP